MAGKKPEKAKKKLTEKERYEQIWYPKGRPKKKKRSVGKALLAVADMATLGMASKVVKRVSCVEKGKKRGLTHREAVKFCAGGQIPKKLKAKIPSKIRRSKRS